MSSLLNIGISSLRANQVGLQTTGHNIANVNTAGYSRQTVSYEALVGQNSGSGYIGNGVSVATVARNYSALLGRQSNAANAASAADAARYAALNQMQDVYSGGDSSLGAAINSMLNAFADVESAPADGTSRNVVLTRISELTARFRSASATLQEQDYVTKQQITNGVEQVNSLAGQVATLNAQISRAISTGQSPNDLLDARDEVIRQINKLVQTSQVSADDGSVSLFVGGSQALVLGSTVGQLRVAETTEYPGSQKLSLYFSQPGGEQVELSASMVGGGEVAGLLKFNNDDLVTGHNLLGRLALAIGDQMNQQNNNGLTLSGNPGGDLFKLSLTSPGYSNITGYTPGTATANVVDSTALKPSDYKVQYGATAADTVLIRLSDGLTRKVADLPVGANGGFVADGLDFELNGTNGTAGQSILFQPFSKAADEIQPLVHNPDDLAVSNAVTANISSTNSGTLQLSKLLTTASDSRPQSGAPVTIHFTSSTNYYITYTDGNGDPARYPPASTDPLVPDKTLSYQSGKAISLPTEVEDPTDPSNQIPLDGPHGWSITLTGTPGANGTDTVVVSNAKDLGDGVKLNAGNASAFLALRDTAIFDGGTTLSDGFSAAMAVIGTRTQSAQYAAELSSTVASNLENDRTAVSGVNLDEEASRLLQYQQAYQASSKVIQIAQSLFDSVLSAVNR